MSRRLTGVRSFESGVAQRTYRRRCPIFAPQRCTLASPWLSSAKEGASRHPRAPDTLSWCHNTSPSRRASGQSPLARIHHRETTWQSPFLGSSLLPECRTFKCERKKQGLATRKASSGSLLAVIYQQRTTRSFCVCIKT